MTNSAAVPCTTSLSKRADQFVVERLVAGQKPRLEDRGADRHVAARLPDRFIDRARGVADLQSHVPQAIENGFGDLLAPGGLLVGQDEQQIDVGFRRHQAAAIAAGGDHGHALGAGGDRRAIEMPRGGGVEDADDLVLHEAQPLGAAPAVAILAAARPAPSRGPRSSRPSAAAPSPARKTSSRPACFSASASTAAVIRAVSKRSSASRAGLCHDAVHDPSGYRTAPTLSRDIVRQQ